MSRQKPTNEGIMQAAEHLFATKGFGESSLRDVIGAARCSTTAFYARFAGKEAVLEALVEQLVTDLRDATVQRLAAARGIDDGINLGIKALVETLLPRKALVRVALAEGAAVAGVRGVLSASYGMLAEVLSGHFSQIGSSDSNGAGWALVGALRMQVERWAVYDAIADEELLATLTSVTHAMFELGTITK